MSRNQVFTTWGTLEEPQKNMRRLRARVLAARRLQAEHAIETDPNEWRSLTDDTCRFDDGRWGFHYEYDAARDVLTESTAA